MLNKTISFFPSIEFYFDKKKPQIPMNVCMHIFPVAQYIQYMVVRYLYFLTMIMED